MADDLVTYERIGRSARIRMDDGKVNAMGMALLSALHAAFDRAADDGALVVLSSGREKIFSAGFDLNVFRSGDSAATVSMLRHGAELALKVLTFPQPVITVTRGHAYPMGAFLMLAADWRIGAQGAWRVGLNEVQIGLTLPRFAVEIARQRLTPAAFNRTTLTGEMFAPDAACAAGFLDEVVPLDALDQTVEAAVERLRALDMAAHAASKLRVRGPGIEAIRAAINEELR